MIGVDLQGHGRSSLGESNARDSSRRFVSVHVGAAQPASDCTRPSCDCSIAHAREFVERLQQEQPAVYQRAARFLIAR